MINKKPKIILKIDLINKFDVKITLLQIINDIDLNKKQRSYFFTKNGWSIYNSYKFMITTSNIIYLPKIALKQKTYLFFNSEKQRYDVLKSLSKAFYLWSNSSIFDEINDGDNKINFTNKTWVIL